MINGIINVYKERGFTSHDVVARLRGILHQKKIGHTGTLDPDAVGVLPVCLGNGTRLCDMLTDTDKVYRAGMLLGMSTDTQDTSGKILSEAFIGGLDEENIRSVIASFVGEYAQIPPMYSALKINGKKLYELAREGRQVDRAPRNVRIVSIDIHSIVPLHMDSFAVCTDTRQAGIALGQAPAQKDKIYVTMTVTCSKGTYIRTLAHDIGDKLGVGGCLCALSREAVGPFDIGSAKTLTEIEALAAQNRVISVVTPVDKMFAGYPQVGIKPEFARLLYNGNPFYLEQAQTGGTLNCQEPGELLMKDGQLVRVYDPDGIFTGIYVYDKKHREFKVRKMFL